MRRMCLATGAVLAVLAGTLLSTGPAQAARFDYFVSPAGSDASPGTSPTAAFRTIQEALNTAPSGATVRLAAGDYREDVVTVRPGVTIVGPSGAIVRGAGGSRVFQVRHDRITLSGFTVDGLHGDPDSMSGYRNKLLYAMSTTPGDGVDRLHIVGMTFRNAGEECVRLRYLVTLAEVAYSAIGPCGIYDFRFGDPGKVGEGVYLGTAPEQRGMHGAPDDRPDVSRHNRVHHNRFDTRGNECVDIKEDSTANVVEYNDCTGQRDPNSGGFDSRGNGNTFRYNRVHGNLGAGIRFGGDTETDGIDNDAYRNTITGNAAGGIKFMRFPQRVICGNRMSGNTGGDSVGDYADRFDPTRRCR